MAVGGHIYGWTGTIFGRTQLDSYENISDKFRKNPTGGLGGDAIMRKKNADERTDGWTADGTLKIEILPQNLIPDVTALQVLKHVKLISLKEG